jgi:hypothetical protein
VSFAQSLGVRLEIVKTSWSALSADLEANSFDIAMGGVTITLDRQKISRNSGPAALASISPWSTALQRSWMLADRAFGQFANVASRSGIFSCLN